MFKRKYQRTMAKRNTKKLLQQAQWVKLSNSGVVRLARSVNYQPRVILLYRPFANYALSSFLRSGRQVSQMIDHYYNTYSGGLLALNIYGGCLVEYSEMIQRKDNQWLERIAGLSNLSLDALITARDQQVDVGRSEDSAITLDDTRLVQIDQALAECRGQLITPHRLSERKV
jgi:hypothetical protein